MLRAQRFDLLAETLHGRVLSVAPQQDAAQQAIHFGDLPSQGNALRPTPLEHGVQTLDLSRRQVQPLLDIQLPPPSKCNLTPDRHHSPWPSHVVSQRDGISASGKVRSLRFSSEIDRNEPIVSLSAPITIIVPR